MNPSCRLSLLAALAALCAGTLSTSASAATPAESAPAALAAAPAEPARERAVFAVSDADPQKWSLTLGNIANAIDGLGADGAEIELVVYGPGIAMLKKDSPVAERLAAALKSGVHIAACQNSMRGFKLEQADLAPGVGVVPSGVVELIRRQHAGYAYVRS
jgi:intracellular sulfur oxidation DsrE/DsrF family protein